MELMKKRHDVKFIVLSSRNISANVKHHRLNYNDIKNHIIPAPLDSKTATALFIIRRSGRFLKYLMVTTGFSLRKKIANFVRLNLITENNPDIVHFAYSGIALEFMDVLDFVDIKIKKIVSCRGSAEIYKPVLDPCRKEQLRILWPKVDFVHCVSQNMMDRMVELGLDKHQAFINFPSVNLENFKFVEREQNHCTVIKQKVIIVSTGRLDHQKGYLYALLAIKALTAKGILLEYHILGEGPEYGPIKYFITDNNLEKIVILHGKVNSDIVKALLEKSHIFLLPSVYEGISNAALEAMASGVPVLVTDSGGMAEVVQNGINGLIVPRCNPNAIEEALLYMIEHYSVAVKYTQNARKNVEDQFNLNNQIANFELKYQSAVDINRTR
jgi:colanic acid/amylovoran biosynthesis glycosyltransferase